MRTAFVNKFLFSYFFSSVLSCSPCCRLRKIIRLFITDSLICVTIHLSVWNRDFNSTDLSKPKQMVVLYESGSALADSSGFWFYLFIYWSARYCSAMQIFKRYLFYIFLWHSFRTSRASSAKMYQSKSVYSHQQFLKHGKVPPLKYKICSRLR